METVRARRAGARLVLRMPGVYKRARALARDRISVATTLPGKMWLKGGSVHDTVSDVIRRSRRCPPRSAGRARAEGSQEPDVVGEVPIHPERRPPPASLERGLVVAEQRSE